MKYRMIYATQTCELENYIPNAKYLRYELEERRNVRPAFIQVSNTETGETLFLKYPLCDNPHIDKIFCYDSDLRRRN